MRKRKYMAVESVPMHYIVCFRFITEETNYGEIQFSKY